MAIDPAAGFARLMQAWEAAYTAGELSKGQGYWHAGNTLDTCVNYLVAAKQKDATRLVARNYPIFQTSMGTPQSPGWWRDDYGWWGIAMLNAAQDDHAAILGLDDSTKAQCLEAERFCWELMNYDWVQGGRTGIRNDPKPNSGIANTITNVLFLMLSLRRYQMFGYPAALDAARQMFDWFWTWHLKGSLLNSKNLVRVTPGQDDGDRAWSGDQGWFWRSILKLYAYDRENERGQRIKTLEALLRPAAFANIFVDKVVRELPFQANYDIDYATGPGVFIRQFAQINQDGGGTNNSLIVATAQAAWDYSGTAGCWYPGTCVYTPSGLLWDMTLKASAQDAYNATMTMV